MSYLSEAHARLADKIGKNTPPKFALFNSPDTFEIDAVEHIEALAAAMNDYLHSLAVELASQGASINPKEYVFPLTDIAGDFTAVCNDRAEDMREAALEFAR